jgi:replicative DNA helicase
LSNQPEKRRPDIVAPHDLDAEEVVLADMLHSPVARAVARERVTSPSYFYDPKNSNIFEAICHLDDSGEAVDPITVHDALRRLGLAEDISPGELVALDCNAMGTENSARTHAGIVAELAARRRALAVGHELATAARDPMRTAESVVQEAEAALMRVEAARGLDELVSMGELAKSAIGRARALATQKGTGLVGLPTGLADLDRLLGGLKPGNLVIIGARPSMGKTSLAVLLAAFNALARTPTLYVSAEMSGEEIAQRAVAIVAEVPLVGLREGRLSDAQWAKVGRAQEALGTTAFQVLDKGSPTAADVRMRAKAVQAKQALGLVVVDYLGLLQHDPAERHELAVGQMAWAFKTLARDLGCPVVLLSQLNRGCEARADKRPVLSDLRDSGQLEAHADVVLFLYRDEVYNPSSPERGTAEVIVAKHRSGPLGTRRVAFLETQARFANLDTEHSREPAF